MYQSFGFQSLPLLVVMVLLSANRMGSELAETPDEYFAERPTALSSAEPPTIPLD